MLDAFRPEHALEELQALMIRVYVDAFRKHHPKETSVYVPFIEGRRSNSYEPSHNHVFDFVELVWRPGPRIMRPKLPNFKLPNLEELRFTLNAHDEIYVEAEETPQLQHKVALNTTDTPRWWPHGQAFSQPPHHKPLP